MPKKRKSFLIYTVNNEIIWRTPEEKSTIWYTIFFREQGYKFVRLDGSMTNKQRTQQTELRQHLSSSQQMKTSVEARHIESEQLYKDE